MVQVVAAWQFAVPPDIIREDSLQNEGTKQQRTLSPACGAAIENDHHLPQ